MPILERSRQLYTIGGSVGLYTFRWIEDVEKPNRPPIGAWNFCHVFMAIFCSDFEQKGAFELSVWIEVDVKKAFFSTEYILVHKWSTRFKKGATELSVWIEEDVKKFSFQHDANSC